MSFVQQADRRREMSGVFDGSVCKWDGGEKEDWMADWMARVGERSVVAVSLLEGL